MKKFRIIGTRYDGSEWSHHDFDVVVDGESEEDVKNKYGGYQSNMDEVIIDSVIEVREVITE